MPKNIESVYIGLAQFSSVLNRFQTFEEKGRFISEMVDALVWNKRGVNEYADFLMDQTLEYREENRRRQMEARERRRAGSAAETAEAPEAAEDPSPDPEGGHLTVKPKAEAYGKIAGKVRLTAEQYIRLSAIYGDKLAAAIDVLDEYLVNGGKIARNYKDHSLVMKKGGWVYNRVFGLDRNGQQNKSFRQQDKDAAAQLCRESFPGIMKLYGLENEQQQ